MFKRISSFLDYLNLPKDKRNHKNAPGTRGTLGVSDKRTLTTYLAPLLWYILPKDLRDTR